MVRKKNHPDRQSLQAIADEVRHIIRDAWKLAESAKTPEEEIIAIEAMREALKFYEDFMAEWVWTDFVERRQSDKDP